jgi:O-antigen/teichoic acid export membrane protein
LRAGLRLRLLFTVPVAVVAYLASEPLARAYDDPALAAPFRVGALLVLAVSLYELFNLSLVGLRRFPALFAARLLMMGTRVAWVVAVVVLGGGAAGVLSGYAASTLLPALVAGAFLLRRYPVGGPAESRLGGAAGGPAGAAAASSPAREVLELAWPLAVSTAAVSLYGQMDRIMVGYFWDAAEVGQYSLARNVMETSLFPVYALNLTLLPALSAAYAAGDTGRCRDLVRRYYVFGLLFGGGVALVLGLVPSPLVTGIYGGSFAYGARLLPHFDLVLVLRILTGVVLPMLLAADRARTYALLTLLAAGVNFLGNLWLVPIHRATGAVWATAVSYVPVLILGGLSLARSLGLRPSPKAVLRPLRPVVPAAAAAGAFLLLGPRVQGLEWGILWALLLLAVYAGLALIVRATTPSELLTLWKSLRSSRRDPPGKEPPERGDVR